MSGPEIDYKTLYEEERKTSNAFAEGIKLYDDLCARQAQEIESLLAILERPR